MGDSKWLLQSKMEWVSPIAKNADSEKSSAPLRCDAEAQPVEGYLLLQRRVRADLEVDSCSTSRHRGKLHLFEYAMAPSELVKELAGLTKPLTADTQVRHRGRLHMAEDRPDQLARPLRA
jgi:hypothetical protein